MGEPIDIPMSEASMPTYSEFGAPTISKARISLPVTSVPSGCAQVPTCPRMFSTPTGPCRGMPEPVKTRSVSQKNRPRMPSATIPSNSPSPQISCGGVARLGSANCGTNCDGRTIGPATN